MQMEQVKIYPTQQKIFQIFCKIERGDIRDIPNAHRLLNVQRFDIADKEEKALSCNGEREASRETQ